VTADTAPAYVEPKVLQVPVETFHQGDALDITDRAGDWFLTRFQDRRWGPRVGFIHCSQLGPG
jgi:hypothetical protein